MVRISRGNENLKMIDYNSRLTGWFFNKVLQEAIKIAELDECERILDFGCGKEKQLKKAIRKPITYIGYDLVPEWTEVKDYTTLKNIDVVFALNVLEHMYSSKELKTHLKNFKNLKAKQLIVALPIENILESVIRIIFNKEAEDFFGHTMPSKQVALELVKSYGLPKKYKRVNFLQIIARFDLKT